MCLIYCVAVTGGFKSFPITELIPSHMNCMAVDNYYNMT